MAVPDGKKQRLYTYTDDEDTAWNTRLSAERANTGQYGAGVAGQPRWFNNARSNNMRGVWGVSADGSQHVFVHCATVDVMLTLFNGGDFLLNIDEISISLTPTGREGERVSAGRLGSVGP